jgi:hypothetical protein
VDEEVGDVDVAPDAFQSRRVGHVALADLQAEELEPRRLRAVADEATGACPRANQRSGQPAADEAGCARYECIGRDIHRYPATAGFTLVPSPLLSVNGRFPSLFAG